MVRCASFPGLVNCTATGRGFGRDGQQDCTQQRNAKEHETSHPPSSRQDRYAPARRHRQKSVHPT